MPQNDELWDAYRALSYERRNDFCLRIMHDNLSNQKYLLYGWPVQELYARYATDFLPGRKDLDILELGPGDNLMTTALWMLDPRVRTLTMLDKFKGEYVEKARYHRRMIELIQTLKHLPRSGFNNYYPFEELDIDRVTSAIALHEDGTVELDRERLTLELIDDFSYFPFDDAGFDYLYSHAVLEHYTDPASSIREMYRVLRPGGLMVHQIDIRDHRDFTDPFRYLEVPSAAWEFGELIFPVNQWRACQFREAFLDSGFDVLHEAKIRLEHDKLDDVHLAPEFAQLPVEDVVITGIVFVLRKANRDS